MNYDVKVNDIFEFEHNDYITLDKYKYNEFYYLFTNKLVGDEEPGKEFFVFKMLSEGLIIETDKEVLKILNKVFSDNFNKKLKIVAEYKG